MESSTLSGTLIDPLIRACPDKRYILTVRDVYTWTDSWIDHNINRPPRKSRFTELDRIRLRAEEFSHTTHDRPLAERNCYALASFFHLWNDHNRRVLDAVPGERLLVVRTGEILDRLPEIASFAGVPESTLRPKEGWQFASPAKHHVLSTMDASYVADLAQQMCGDLMDRWFPGVGPEAARP
jgi:hypothetical protein